ncbi:zonular occludens toxin domain-containing protein [Melaminivora sp.]
MITLFTGMPGAGKTAAMLDVLRQLAADRPVFVHFDPAERLRPEQKLLHETIKIPHQPVHAATWHEQVSDGGILIIDEAQGCWRPRGPSAKVPEAIAALETHRHAGIDIFLTTQSPRLIDANVRGLVGRHVHIRDTGWLGRWWYEWPETNEGLAWKTCPVKKRYKLPRQVFDLYTSANEHYKPVRATPKTLALVGLLLACLGVLIFLIIRTFNNHAAPAPKKEPPSVAVAAPVQAAPDQLPNPGITITAPDERVDFIPRLSDRPWTAPAYDHMRTVVHMPTIAGGLCIRGECACFAPDGTRLLEISSKACSEWMATRPFNPYQSQQLPATARASSAGKSSGRTESSEDQTGPARAQSVTSVPAPAGVVNPRAEAKSPGPLYLPAPKI